MLRKFIYLVFFILCVSIFSIGSMPEPRNPPLGNTGAPGETACMLSGCHSGGNYTGIVQINGIPDTVDPDKIYDLSIINKSNAVRSGFQLTVLDTANKYTGTLIKGTGVNIAKDNFSGKTYARQEFAINLSNGQASWNLQWKSPVSMSGNEIIFYFSSLCANGDGDNGKDNSIKNSKRIIFNMPVGNKDFENKSKNIFCYYRDGYIILDTRDDYAIDQLYVTNLQGNSFILNNTAHFNKFKTKNKLKGLYFVQFKADNRFFVEKIIVP